MGQSRQAAPAHAECVPTCSELLVCKGKQTICWRFSNAASLLYFRAKMRRIPSGQREVQSHMHRRSMPLLLLVVDASGAQVAPYSAYAGALRLDGPTLANLELLENSGGTSEGSLMACLDSCASPGAQWTC